MIIKEPGDVKKLTDTAREIMTDRQRAYQRTFEPSNNAYAKTVLEDLARFCKANETTFHPDARVHAVAEGRREVWLRIRAHLDLDPETFSKTFIKKEI